MTDMTAENRPISSKERLLSAVADIQYYLRHPHEKDCPSCAVFDELQSAALGIIRELKNLENSIVELSDDVEKWAGRRCKSDVR